MIFGAANPSGKLSMSFPKSVGQCPIYYNHINTGKPKWADDDQYQPYRSNYIDCGNLPLYSFGFGMSYSNFVYESMELSNDSLYEDTSISVSVTIKNDSETDGKETVMLFMHDLFAENSRPIQQLIAFKKVFIAAGQRKTVNFTISESMLRYWNNNNVNVSEKGEFTLSTGYADHLILTKSFYLR